jgi:lipoprotein-releasing system permease protein
MRYVVSTAILIVAGFGIYNVLTIMISQKQQEIAILRSIGYNSFEITELFLLQGLMLGIAGGLAGIISGFLISAFLGSLQIYPKDFIRGGQIPIAYEFSIYYTAFLLAFFSSIVASILPARQAGKLTPIEIIRKGSQ